MYAGISVFDITPPRGLCLMGYARPPRPNQGAHDPLRGLGLYLRSGDTEAVVVSLDLLYVGQEVCEAVYRGVMETAGIPAENVFICATHTHSAPRAYLPLDDALTPEEKDYMSSLSLSIVRAVASAKKDSFPAKAAIRETVCGAEAGVGGNRDVRGGIADPRLGLLCVWDETNALRAVLANYALHPTLLREDNLLCSADFPGCMRAHIEKEIPGCAAGFLQGASGDQSTRYFRRGNRFEEAERIGLALAHAALSEIQRPPCDAADDLHISHRSLPVRLRAFPPENALLSMVAEKTAEYEKMASRGDAMAAHEAKLAMYGAECKLQYARALNRARSRYEHLHAHVRALRLGDNCLVGVMGECFAEYGLAVKALSGARITLFSTLTGGALPGYVCTPQAYARGGYEPDASMLDETFGLSLSDAAVACARSLF